MSFQDDLLINSILFYIIFELNIKAEECQETAASDKKVKKIRFVSVFSHQRLNQNCVKDSTVNPHYIWIIGVGLCWHH